MKVNNSQKDFTKTYKDVGPYLGLGTQLAATIVLMFFLGRWLDGKFDLSPLFTLAFSFLGGFAGIYNFIKAVLDINKKEHERKDKSINQK